MQLTRRAALGGVELDEIDESVVIREIDPGSPPETVSTAERMGGSGSRVTGAHFGTLEIRISFGIDLPKTMLAERRRVYDECVKWARRLGWLTISTMPDRQAWVEKATVTSPGEMWDWTKDFTITFRCFSVPYWQDVLPITAGPVSTANGSVSLEVPGTAETVIDVSCRNVSGQKITNIYITAGDKNIDLPGIDLAANGLLTIDHTNDGLLRIRKGSTSVYHLYTGSDDLYAQPGQVQVHVRASRAVELTASCCGRWV